MTGQELKIKIKEAGRSQKEIAELLGVTAQSLSSVLAAKDVRSGSVEKIADALGIPVGFFYGDNLQQSTKREYDTPSSTSDNPEVGKPYYDVDFEGGFMELTNSQTCVPTTNIVVRGFEKADLWCNVTGHSMEPKINHGDIIALHRCTVDDVQFGEIYAVVLDTIRTIKILRKGSTPDSFLFVPINSDYDPQEYPKSRILNVFEVIGSVSKFF